MRYDLVIVGMGSGGMVAAEVACRLGLRVAVVERDRVGGDCLWTGCVPSKALLASAKAAHHVRTAATFGLGDVAPPVVDTAAVWARLREVQAEIASTDDDPDRYRRMGVALVEGEAALAGPHAVEVDGRRLEARRILLCTGSRPKVPPIPGLLETGFATSDDLFARPALRGRVGIVGGGPIGIELGQGLVRLGLPVTVLQQGDRILPRDDPRLVDLLRQRLEEEGVVIHTGVAVTGVTSSGGAKVLHGRTGAGDGEWEVDEVVVAAGRSANVEGLRCEEAGIEVGEDGIVVDAHMRTAARSVYAVGDVVGGHRFTHSAANQAALAVRNMFFPGASEPSDLVPWCTFTDPELAHVGLTEAEAREVHGGAVGVHRWSLEHNDRARADGTGGEILVVTGRRDRLLGAHVLGPAGGEVVHEMALAIARGLRLRDLARLVHIYPTIATSVGQLAAERSYARAARYGWVARIGRIFD